MMSICVCVPEHSQSLGQLTYTFPRFFSPTNLRRLRCLSMLVLVLVLAARLLKHPATLINRSRSGLST